MELSGRLPSLARNLHGNDLLIAIEKPPPPADEALSIGIAGRGFDGDLTSDSTRLDGYVLSTDIAPTVLARFGVATPAEVSGQEIGSEASIDPAAVERLGDRMAAIPRRRGPVVGFALLAWSVLPSRWPRQPRAGGWQSRACVWSGWPRLPAPGPAARRCAGTEPGRRTGADHVRRAAPGPADPGGAGRIPGSRGGSGR